MCVMNASSIGTQIRADREHDPKSAHFSTQDYMQIGRDLCLSIDEYFCEDESHQEMLRSTLMRQVIL